MDIDFTRRSFVAASAASAIVAATGSRRAYANEDGIVDVVVCGAGISGLAAAVQAAELGLSVVLLEKADFVGGNGLGTEGIFAIGSRLQKEAGIEINPKDILSRELEESQFRADGSIWYDMVSRSAENFEWLEEQGVLFNGTVDNYGVGLFETAHWFEGHAGAIGYVPPMAAKAEWLGVDIRLGHRATGLIMEQGAVSGVVAHGPDGAVEIACKAAILATGGIGHNEELLLKKGWSSKALAEMIVQGVPAVEGDGYLMAMSAGGKDDIMNSSDQTFLAIGAFGVDMTPPYDSALNGGFGIAAHGNLLWVNQDGDRFTNEGLGFINMAATGPACNANRESYILFDRAVLDAYSANEEDASVIEEALSGDYAEWIAQADSVEGLADAFGIDPEALASTVDRYNELCAIGDDLDFGKDCALMQPLTNSPLYIAKMVQLLISVDGGIRCNKKAQVLDNDLLPIPGLYAVGLDGAMLWRNIYTQNMPGTAMANNVNSGRHAARDAARYIATL